MRDLLLAAALHDSGAFSLRERLDIMQFEISTPGITRRPGYRLLKSFPHFERAAEIVRFHHLPWEHGRGEQWRGRQVPPGSHLLHLADRVSVLHGRPVGLPPGGPGRSRGWWSRVGVALQTGICRGSRSGGGAVPGFWLEVAAAGDDDLRNDPAFGAVILSESRLQGAGAPALADRGLPQPVHRDAHERRGGGRRLSRPARRGHRRGRPEGRARSRPARPREARRPERDAREGEGAHAGGSCHASQPPAARLAGAREDRRAWRRSTSGRTTTTSGSTAWGTRFGSPAAQIPLESRIVAVADVFTALTEERPYRRGMSAREATGILRIWPTPARSITTSSR